jgi:dCMP deaminase
MCNKVNWDERFMNLANYFASWSKDRSTGVGAVIVNHDNTEIVKGYNGFPRGANDDIDARHEKPAKYMWTEHAERNAIFNAARQGISTNGCKIYVNYFPCVECSRAIIQSGITDLFAPKPDFTHQQWGESWKTALEMLTECGVKVTYYDL